MEQRHRDGGLAPDGSGQGELVAVALAAALTAACDRLRHGMFLLDAGRRLLFTNASARQVLAAGDAVVEVGGRLSLCQAAQMDRLDAFLARPARAPHAGSARSIAFRLERASGQPAYRMLVTRLEIPAVDPAGTIFLCMVFDPHAARQVPLELLVELYGLSRAEAAVAADLIAGLRVSELARVRRLSPSTVRTHLRHIFRKCEVHSQAQLLQLLSLGPSAT
jgi:DNA-binding CsgD family transcriptional regulator